MVSPDRIKNARPAPEGPRSARRNGIVAMAVLLLCGGFLLWPTQPRATTSPSESQTRRVAKDPPYAAAIVPRLQSIRLMPPNASVAKGLTTKFVALGSYSDNEVRDVTHEARWSSSTSVATPVGDSPGSMSGAEVGVSTVRAAIADIVAAADLTVTATSLVGITISPDAPAVPVGEPFFLAATGSYADGSTRDITAEATWESSSPDIALREDQKGAALGASEGSSVIVAKLGGVTGSTVVRVEPAMLATIHVLPVDATAVIGDTVQFRATSRSSNGDERDITSMVSWSSSNISVLKMDGTTDEGGNGTALGRGKVSVTAVLAGLRSSSTLTVH
jgi:trimeric autotransporter adhesin